MAEAAVNFLLQTLRDLLGHEVNFLLGVGGKVKGLETQLKEMLCLLKDADRRQYESSTISEIIAQIRDLSYRAEDVIETYGIESSSSSSRTSRSHRGAIGFIRQRLAKTKYSCGLMMSKGLTLHALGREISGITSEFQSVTAKMREYGITASIIFRESSSSAAGGGAAHDTRWNRQTYPFEIEDDQFFIGMNEDLARLVSLVVDDKKYRVISVWGMGGSGKTSIARKVYNHNATMNAFERCAWVCISQQFEITSVLKHVLGQLIKEKYEKFNGWTETELMQKLHEVQIERRCIIVVDDLWRIEHWEKLEHFFVAAKTNTKVLLTTRNKNVAEVGFPYELPLLSEENGWKLLKHKALKEKDVSDFGGETEYFEQVGKEMVGKCGRLPLVISTLGGVLNKRLSLKEWQLVNKNIDEYIYRQEDHRIHAVLDLSFDDLPFYLKPCFLIMGSFEEDQQIYIADLCKLWISAGMVQFEQHRRGRETMMDVAERYFFELAARCLVQVLKENDLPGKQSSKGQLHDVVRDLCFSKVAREDFRLKVMNYEGGKYSIISPPVSNSSATRHLTIHLREDVSLRSNDASRCFREETTKSIRSLQFLGNEAHKIEIPNNMSDFRMFKLLRVLAFRFCKFEGGALPKEIGSLLCLRYLQFDSCDLGKLPSSVGNLTNLYSLDLRWSYIDELPDAVNKLRRLKHLFLPFGEGCRLTLEGLDELETLKGFNSSVHDLMSVYKMKNLRYLHSTLHDNESLSMIINGISTHWRDMQEFWLIISTGCELNAEEGSSNLQRLLTCSNVHCLFIHVPVRKLPVDFGAQIVLPNLVSLWLTGCELEDDPIELLEKLPCLESLVLFYKSFLGEIMTCNETGFPRLTLLRLRGLPKLRDWRIERGAMPNLLQLEISSCPDLKMIPGGLKFVTTLKRLKIQKDLSKRVMDDGREGEDFLIVRHVQQIYED